MKKKFNILVSSFVIALTLAKSQLSFGSEQHENDSPKTLSNVLTEDVCSTIGTYLALEVVKDDSSEQAIHNLSKKLVLLHPNWETWGNIAKKGMQVHMPLWKALHGVKTSKDEEIYQICSNMKLIYKPDPNSDVGMITQSIPKDHNPFQYIFDLYSSNCGTAYLFLKITTDPVAFFEIEKDNPKLNILIAPYFLINKLISTTAKSFANIMPNWNKDKAPVAIFWRWSADDNLSWFDYLSSASWEAVCSKNLFENWQAAVTAGRGRAMLGVRGGGGGFPGGGRFHVSF